MWYVFWVLHFLFHYILTIQRKQFLYIIILLILQPAPEQITSKEKKRKKLDEIVLGLSAAKGQSPTSSVSYDPPRSKGSSVLPEVTVTPAAPPSSTAATPPTQKPFSVTVTNVPSPHASSKELSSFLQQSLEQSNKPQKSASSATPKPYSHEAKVNKWLAEQANVDTRRRNLPPRLAPDEHVPVVHRVTGKRLMGHKAPQLKHLAQWIAENPMYDIDSKWTESIKEHVKLPQDVRNPRHSPMQPTSSVPERKKGRPPTLDSTSTNVLSSNTHLNQNLSGLNPALLASLSSLSAFDPKTLAATLSNLTGFDPKLLSSLSSFDPKNNPLLNSFNSMPNLLGNMPGGNIFANLAGLGLPGFPSLDMNTLTSTSTSTDIKSKTRKPAESSGASTSKSSSSQFPFVFPNPNMLYPQLGLSGLSPFGVHSGMSSAYDALGLLSGNLAASSSASSLHNSSHSSRSSSKTTAARSSTVTTTSSASRQQKVSDRTQSSHLPQILLPPDPYLLESLSKQTLNYEAALKAEKRSREGDNQEAAATDLSKADKKKLPFDPLRSQMPPEFAAVQEKLLKGDKKDIDISKMLLEQMASGALSASLVSSTEAKKSKELEKESYEKLGKPPEYLSRMPTDDSSISIAHKRTLDEMSNEPENLAIQSIPKKMKENSSEIIRNIDKRSDTTNTNEMDLEDLIAPSTVIKTGMKASDFEMNRAAESATSLIVSNPERDDKLHQRNSSPREKEPKNDSENSKKSDSTNVDESREDNPDENVETSSTDGGRKGIRKKGRKSSEESSLGPRRELRSSAGRQSTESLNH